MLDALHARIGSFARADLEGDVPGDVDAMRPGLVREGEEGLVRYHGVDLDEVHPALLPGAHGRARLGAVRNPDRVGIQRAGSVDAATRRHHARAHPRALGDLLTPALDLAEVAAHVADAGHPVRDQQRQVVDVRIPRGVHVHVPETRDHELARGLDDPRPVGNLQLLRLADLRDPLAANQDRHVSPGRGLGDVDQRHVREGDGSLRYSRVRLATEERRQQREEQRERVLRGQASSPSQEAPLVKSFSFDASETSERSRTNFTAFGNLLSLCG